MLRFSKTKSSMLYNLLSAGVALWVILDKLIDKTTDQGWIGAWGRSAAYTIVITGLVVKEKKKGKKLGYMLHV